MASCQRRGDYLRASTEMWGVAAIKGPVGTGGHASRIVARGASVPAVTSRTHATQIGRSHAVRPTRQIARPPVLGRTRVEPCGRTPSSHALPRVGRGKGRHGEDLGARAAVLALAPLMGVVIVIGRPYGSHVLRRVLTRLLKAPRRARSTSSVNSFSGRRGRTEIDSMHLGMASNCLLACMVCVRLG